jgi:hypothetical protein
MRSPSSGSGQQQSGQRPRTIEWGRGWWKKIQGRRCRDRSGAAVLLQFYCVGNSLTISIISRETMPANSVRCRRPLHADPVIPPSLCRTARASAWLRGCSSTDDSGGPAPGVEDVRRRLVDTRTAFLVRAGCTYRRSLASAPTLAPRNGMSAGSSAERAIVIPVSRL